VALGHTRDEETATLVPLRFSIPNTKVRVLAPRLKLGGYTAARSLLPCRFLHQMPTSISVEKTYKCPACNGHGFRELLTCSRCDGKGEVSLLRHDDPKQEAHQIVDEFRSIVGLPPRPGYSLHLTKRSEDGVFDAVLGSAPVERWGSWKLLLFLVTQGYSHEDATAIVEEANRASSIDIHVPPLPGQP